MRNLWEYDTLTLFAALLFGVLRAGEERVGELCLGGAAKQLAEDALLDVLHLVDAGRQGGHQLVVDVWLSSQGLEAGKLRSQDPASAPRD